MAAQGGTGATGTGTGVTLFVGAPVGWVPTAPAGPPRVARGKGRACGRASCCRPRSGGSGAAQAQGRVGGGRGGCRSRE
jgi:hypothetical protein